MTAPAALEASAPGALAKRPSAAVSLASRASTHSACSQRSGRSEGRHQHEREQAEAAIDEDDRRRQRA
jgi:hypothetical protein